MSLLKTPGRTSRKNRLPVSLSHRLDHKLLGYTAAASAAGVSMIALAQLSQAEIVYTPTNQRVNGTLALDLNNDGITDFTINNLANSNCGTGPQCSLQILYVSPSKLNGVVGADSFARGLSAGKWVGRGDTFESRYGRMEHCRATRTSRYSSGSWINVKNRYLGLEFSLNGETHYGWARLSVRLGRRCTEAVAILTGYAYETVPGEPIRAGKRGPEEVSEAERSEATLGALALGNVGLVAWRRDEDPDSRLSPHSW